MAQGGHELTASIIKWMTQPDPVFIFSKLEGHVWIFVGDLWVMSQKLMGSSENSVLQSYTDLPEYVSSW